jgi:hypothetical protein
MSSAVRVGVRWGSAGGPLGVRRRGMEEHMSSAVRVVAGALPMPPQHAEMVVVSTTRACHVIRDQGW